MLIANYFLTDFSTLYFIFTLHEGNWESFYKVSIFDVAEIKLAKKPKSKSDNQKIKTFRKNTRQETRCNKFLSVFLFLHIYI